VVAQVALAGLIVLCQFLGPGWPESVAGALAVAGGGIATMGVVLFLAGMFSLGRSLTPFPKPKGQASMHEGGVYGFVRHPMYGGVILAVAGWSMVRTPLGLAAAALLTAFLDLKSRREEVWLVERYPRYDVYRRRVRWRFVPGIR
jgi:protein-S-isoprenylcysteine O-methyltransferase Ste14